MQNNRQKLVTTEGTLKCKHFRATVDTFCEVGYILTHLEVLIRERTHEIW